MAAAAAAQAAMDQQARINRVTQLPLFYGIPSKDTIAPRHLIQRITFAARIANWNTDEKKIDNFYMLLRERALIWWEQLEYEGINIAVWDTVKTEFLAAYEPKCWMSVSGAGRCRGAL